MKSGSIKLKKEPTCIMLLDNEGVEKGCQKIYL